MWSIIFLYALVFFFFTVKVLCLNWLTDCACLIKISFSQCALSLSLIPGTSKCPCLARRLVALGCIKVLLWAEWVGGRVGWMGWWDERLKRLLLSFGLFKWTESKNNCSFWLWRSQCKICLNHTVNYTCFWQLIYQIGRRSGGGSGGGRL